MQIVISSSLFHRCRQKKCTHDFNLKNQNGKDHLRDLGVEGRVILKRIRIVWKGGRLWTW